MIDYDKIGMNIKILRTKAGMKQGKLAELTEVTEQHISHIECARTKLSLPLLVKISEVLSTDIYSILGTDAVYPKLEAFDTEIAYLLKNATPLQRELCIDLCKAVVKREF